MRASYEINQGRSADSSSYHYPNRSNDNIYRGPVGYADFCPFPIKESPTTTTTSTPNEADLNGIAGNVLIELAPKGRNGLDESAVQVPLQPPPQIHSQPSIAPLSQQQDSIDKRFTSYKLASEEDDLNSNKRNKVSNKISNIYTVDENQTHLENHYAINDQQHHIHNSGHHHQHPDSHQLHYSSTYATNHSNQHYSQHHHLQQQQHHQQHLNKAAEYCWQREDSLAEENHEQVAAAVAAASAAAAAAARLDQSSASAVVFNSSGSVEGSRYRVSGAGQSAASEVGNDFKQNLASTTYPSSLWPDELITEASNSHARFASTTAPYHHHHQHHPHHHHSQVSATTAPTTLLSSGHTSDDELSSEKQQQQQQQQQHGNNAQQPPTTENANNEYNQLRILEMRKEKSRDAARSRRSKENHEFYELAKLLPLPAAITSQLDFLDKASIIRLTISFLKLRQFSVNGYPPWAPDFTTLGSVNPYSSQSLANYAEQYSTNSQDDSQSRPTSVGLKQTPNIGASNVSSTSATSTSHGYSNAGVFDPNPKSHEVSTGRHSDLSFPVAPSSVAFPVIDSYQQPSNSHQDRSLLINEKNLSKTTSSLFDVHQGTHILQSLDGFAFAIGRDGRFLYISETVSMYLGLSQVEMTGSSVFDYAHQQDHEELAKQLGIPFTTNDSAHDVNATNSCESPPPASVHSQYSAASNETFIDDHVNPNNRRKRSKTQPSATPRGAYGRGGKRNNKHSIKIDASTSEATLNKSPTPEEDSIQRRLIKDGNIRIDNQGTEEDPLVRQFCIRMKSTLTKRGCQHFKSSGYRVVHVVAHLRSYQSNDHGHLMDPLDDVGTLSSNSSKQSDRRKSLKSVNKDVPSKDTVKGSIDNQASEKKPVSKSKIIGMVAVAIALPPPSINELRLESGTFVLRLSLDLRVTHIEPKITELLHYPLELIAGRSLYSFIHPADVYQVQKCHKDLLKKGQMMSGYYRMLSRSGGYIWIQTCATLICNNTFNGQVPVLPNSPMPNSGSVNMTHNDHEQHPYPRHIHKSTGYMAPPSIAGSDVIPYGAGSSHSKIASPALSSHISSNYDNQDQDQCVIFVNYMITNIVDSDEILDVCQSTVPACPFSGTTNNNNAIFNSPSSSCSSPCLGGTMKANTSCGSYASPVTPNSSANLLSPRPRVHPLDSKYKTATGADLVGSTNYVHHQQPHHQQHHHQTTTAVYPTGAGSYPTPVAAAAANTWDTATAAAVAAVSNLTSHHHHHSAANAYAQFENNHQTSAHSFSYSASNHHSAYYNYYGYYGNGFI